MSAPRRPQHPNLHPSAAPRAGEDAIRPREPEPAGPRAIWAPEDVRGGGDPEIARVAARQAGVVTRTQLVTAGLTGSAIKHRLRTGRLYPLHRGVYLVGRPSMEPLAADWAAALFFGGDAVLSHRSAAALWGLIENPPPEVELTLIGRDMRPRPGLRVHRTDALDQRDTRVRRYLPVTAPARTLIDLAGETGADTLEKALAEARAQDLISAGALEGAIERAPTRRGVGALRALLAAENGPALTDSVLQRRLLELIRAAQLPEPLVNEYVLGLQVDFLWPAQRLIIETDGVQFHGHPKAFQRDRRRDQILVAAGYRVIRVTSHQLDHEPMAVIARIAMALQVAAA